MKGRWVGYKNICSFPLFVCMQKVCGNKDLVFVLLRSVGGNKRVVIVPLLTVGGKRIQVLSFMGLWVGTKNSFVQLCRGTKFVPLWICRWVQIFLVSSFRGLWLEKWDSFLFLYGPMAGNKEFVFVTASIYRQEMLDTENKEFVMFLHGSVWKKWVGTKYSYCSFMDLSAENFRWEQTIRVCSFMSLYVGTKNSCSSLYVFLGRKGIGPNMWLCFQ